MYSCDLVIPLTLFVKCKIILFFSAVQLYPDCLLKSNPKKYFSATKVSSGLNKVDMTDFISSVYSDLSFSSVHKFDE